MSNNNVARKLIRLLPCFVAFLVVAPHLFAQQKKAPENIDLLVSGGTVVTMDAQRRLISDGAIAVRGDAIVAVGTRAALEAQYAPARRIDARGKLVMPGLINGHTHAAMTLFRGIADDLNLQDWLTKFIFPAEAKNVTEPFVTAGTRLGVLEMIHGGTTTYVDMYYFEDTVARATKAAGMRGVLGETILDFPAPDNKTVSAAYLHRDISETLERRSADPRRGRAPFHLHRVRANASLLGGIGAPLSIAHRDSRGGNEEGR